MMKVEKTENAILFYDGDLEVIATKATIYVGRAPDYDIETEWYLQILPDWTRKYPADKLRWVLNYLDNLNNGKDDDAKLQRIK